MTLSHPESQLHNAANTVLIEFRDASGELGDASTVKFALGMNMPGMVMQAATDVERTDTPRRYRAKVKPGMSGDWIAKLSFDGPAGKGEASFAVNVKQ